MSQYERQLVDGLIPAGKACPWWKPCTMRVDRCPSEEKPKENNYSCALARLNEVIDEGKFRKQRLPQLEKVRDGFK